MSEQYIFRIIWVALWILLFLTCGFAFWKGGRPERYGAILILALALIGTIINLTVPGSARPVVRVVADGLTAFGLMVIAIRYASLWLGAAMLFQGAQFSLLSFYFVMEKKPDAIYGIVNNINLVGILGSLVAGTIVTQRRIAARRRAAEAAAPA